MTLGKCYPALPVLSLERTEQKEKMSQKAEIGQVLVWNVIWVEASVCSLGIRNDSLLLTCEDSVTMRRQMQKAARPKHGSSFSS